MTDSMVCTWQSASVAGVADADGVSSTGEVGVGTGTGEQRGGHARVGGIGGGGGDSGVNGLR